MLSRRCRSSECLSRSGADVGAKVIRFPCAFLADESQLAKFILIEHEFGISVRRIPPFIAEKAHAIAWISISITCYARLSKKFLPTALPRNRQQCDEPSAGRRYFCAFDSWHVLERRRHELSPVYGAISLSDAQLALGYHSVLLFMPPVS